MPFLGQHPHSNSLGLIQEAKLSTGIRAIIQKIAAPIKQRAAVPPPNIRGSLAVNVGVVELKIAITAPAVKAVAAAMNIAASPDARASAAVAIFTFKKCRSLANDFLAEV
jgi:hypothetical protein